MTLFTDRWLGEAGLWEASVCTVMVKVIGDKRKVTSGNTGIRAYLWGMGRGKVNLGGIYVAAQCSGDCRLFQSVHMHD